MSTTPRNHPSRPTTPLRPLSRASLRSSKGASTTTTFATPLDGLEPAFAELSDSMADLEANMMHIQLLHESLSRFSENFAAFLYGLNMNAFCVDFPEAPISESFRRVRPSAESQHTVSTTSFPIPAREPVDIEATVMTTDSFVEHPPSSKASSKFTTPAPATKRGRADAPARGGRGLPRGRGSSIARGSTRGRGRG